MLLCFLNRWFFDTQFEVVTMQRWSKAFRTLQNIQPATNRHFFSPKYAALHFCIAENVQTQAIGCLLTAR